MPRELKELLLQGYAVHEQRLAQKEEELRAEGIIAAPEATHGIATAIAEANKCKEEGVSRTILFNLCGHGNFDMKAYEDYFAGSIVKHELSTEEINASLAELDTPEI